MAGARPNFGSGVRTDNRCEGKLEARTNLQTKRKTFIELTMVKGVHTENSTVENREMNWCVIRVLTGLFLLLHLWPAEAERV